MEFVALVSYFFARSAPIVRFEERRLKDQWHQARAVATMHRANASNLEIQKTSTQVQSLVADNELSFRAMDGHADALRYDVPCGFDVSQLDVLFPEEMGAYQRWKKVRGTGNDCE